MNAAASPQRSPNRKRRGGADTASAWAKGLRFRYGREVEDKWHFIRTGFPANSAKSVLLAICNYVDENGHAWPSIERLADDIDLSWDATAKRLADLEWLGVIARYKCWLDEHGVRNREGRGRPTSWEIVLLFDVTQEAIDAKLATKTSNTEGEIEAAEGSEIETPHAAAEGSRPETPAMPAETVAAPPIEGSEIETPPGSQLSDGSGVSDRDPQGSLPSDPNPHLNPQESLPKGSPDVSIAPIASVEAPQAGKQEANTAGEPVPTLEAFKAAHPAQASTYPDQVAAKFAGLSDADRRLIVEAARGYGVWCRRHERTPKDPVRFFDPALWKEFAPLAPKPAPPKREPVFVPAGNEASEAHRAWCRLVGRPFPEARPNWEHGGVEGRFFYSEFPPLGRGIDPDGDWPIVEPGTANWAAWQQWLVANLGRGIEPDLISTGETFQTRNGSGKPIELPRRIRGWRFPAPWPPRKDGTFAQAPPAGAGDLMTEDDKHFVEQHGL